jgi:hypothetical protein
MKDGLNLPPPREDGVELAGGLTLTPQETMERIIARYFARWQLIKNEMPVHQITDAMERGFWEQAGRELCQQGHCWLDPERLLEVMVEKPDRKRSSSEWSASGADTLKA